MEKSVNRAPVETGASLSRSRASPKGHDFAAFFDAFLGSPPQGHFGSTSSRLGVQMTSFGGFLGQSDFSSPVLLQASHAPQRRPGAFLEAFETHFGIYVGHIFDEFVDFFKLVCCFHLDFLSLHARAFSDHM